MADLRQMRYFVTLAETLHFGRAAERLNLTQPPLSRQIAALEKSLGVKLLDRHTRHTTLTPAGRRFLEDAKATLISFDQACENARLAEMGELGELKVGFMMHAAFTVIPKLTRAFLSAYPQVKLHLKEVVPSALPDDIMGGRIDAGVMFSPGTIKGMNFRAIHQECLCLAVPADHPLARRPEITPALLDGEGLIFPSEEAAPSLRDAILGWFAKGGMKPVIRLETQLQQTIVSLVAEGLGVAVVPKSMAKMGIEGVVFRPLQEAPEVEHGIAWRIANRNPSLPLFLRTSGTL